MKDYEQIRFFARNMTQADRLAMQSYLSYAAAAPFPENMIPQSGIAVFGDNSDLPLAVLIIYLECSSPVAVLGFCSFDPAAIARDKYRAAECAVNAAKEYCRNKGKTHILAFFGQRSLNRILDKNGFSNADNNVQSKYISLK